jgi:hypothetical protein
MSLLSRKNGISLLYFLILLGIAIPHFTVPTQTVNGNTQTTLVNQATSTILGSSSVKIASSQAPAQVPLIQGWGGVTLDEASNGQMQSTLLRLNQSGYNGVRIGFSGSITRCSSGELGSWNPDWFSQTIQFAQQYNMWVILDYHSYGDLVDSNCQTQWLSFWNGVLSTNWGYNRIVWEPINEPAGSVSLLSSAYQAWITQARSLGDMHWIAIENTISNGGCSFDPVSLLNCYPVVTDPLNETFLSIHPYFFYDIWLSDGYGNCNPSITNTWGNSTAECVADIYNQGMLQASGKYHMPILDTEGGAVYYSCNNVCASPPDFIGTDDASYSNTTFHFIQYLTNRMQSENMGWLWWEAGEGSCCGALDTWGKLLRFQPATPPPPHDQPPILQAPTGLVIVAGYALSFKVNASDMDTPPQNLTLSCLDCPAGVSFPGVSGPGQVTGVFTWTPSLAQAGQAYNITFTTTDGFQSSDATIVITVYPPNKPPTNIPPVLIIPGNQSMTVAQTLSFEVNATDIDDSPQTLMMSCTSCATLGATFTTVLGTSQVTGIVNWVLSNSRVPGNYNANFTVTDGVNTSIATIHVTITKANVEMTASVYPKTLTLGLSSGSASEFVSITNGFNPTGSITFTAFLDSESCTVIPSFTSTVPINGNGNYASQPFAPQKLGTYRWEASYSGDADNASFSSTCGSPARTLTVSTASPPSQPQSHPPCISCNSSNGSSALDSPIVWLIVVGTAGLAIIAAVTMHGKRIKRA